MEIAEDYEKHLMARHGLDVSSKGRYKPHPEALPASEPRPASEVRRERYVQEFVSRHNGASSSLSSMMEIGCESVAKSYTVVG